MKNKGFTLLEVIIAIFILAIGILGSFSAIQRATSLISHSSSELKAAYLAQEGIEIVRNIRDSNWLEARWNDVPWDQGLDNCHGGCEGDYNMLHSLPTWSGEGRYLNIDNNGFYSYSFGESTNFKRRIFIISLEPDTLNVRVEVYWSERGVSQTFSVETNLYNWR